MSRTTDDQDIAAPGGNWTVVVADDHPIIQSSVARLLKKRLGLPKQPLLATNYDELCDAVTDGGADLLVVTDLVMPGMRGLESLKRVRSLAPEAMVVVYSSNASQQLAQSCLEIGCKGFVGKRAGEDVFIAAIVAILEGGTATELGENPSAVPQEVIDRIALVAQLSPQQMKVFLLLGDGLLNKQIAYKLGISEATVKAHVGKILETLNINSRSQAAIASAWMVEHGLM
ncbi:response regulator [Oharaeibacter diazotrophicus]|uniref:LuxR family two component transcriptional regulator n=1 Tax=Oharaeibacter diazotrophicus TaxID=1920512 RepID=A0A4V3CWK4_9HYPH|nr:response regulator transcription factor [Oharaeibacter diazotrophicus]TDP86698.1 LuxR family two component transcriptional regulator [Oharaeibacter diazotrophicus]BBE71360.1 transcriptional regulatory protein DegU [Pleomorphomonas sp. SM30]GLS78115.1 DNA-binding response regulator [Oharaeibacter diazotrophicus]